MNLRTVVLLLFVCAPAQACFLYHIPHQYDDDDSAWGCPEVERRSPVAGATDVVTDRVEVIWERATDGLSLLVMAQDGIPVPGDTVLSDDGRVVTFVPTDGFDASATYQVRLGGRCDELETWTFTMAP